MISIENYSFKNNNINESILSYGLKSNNIDLKEINELHNFFINSISAFEKLLIKNKKFNSFNSFNLGYQLWIYLGGKDCIGSPYNKWHMLSNEFYLYLKQKYILTEDNRYNPFFLSIYDILPSKYWDEEKEPILFLIDLLNKKFNIQLKLNIELHTNSDGSLRVFEDGKFSWVVKLSL